MSLLIPRVIPGPEARRRYLTPFSTPALGHWWAKGLGLGPGPTWAVLVWPGERKNVPIGLLPEGYATRWYRQGVEGEESVCLVLVQILLTSLTSTRTTVAITAPIKQANVPLPRHCSAVVTTNPSMTPAKLLAEVRNMASEFAWRTNFVRPFTVDLRPPQTIHHPDSADAERLRLMGFPAFSMSGARPLLLEKSFGGGRSLIVLPAVGQGVLANIKSTLAGSPTRSCAIWTEGQFTGLWLPCKYRRADDLVDLGGYQWAFRLPPNAFMLTSSSPDAAVVETGFRLLVTPTVEKGVPLYSRLRTSPRSR